MQRPCRTTCTELCFCVQLSGPTIATVLSGNAPSRSASRMLSRPRHRRRQIRRQRPQYQDKYRSDTRETNHTLTACGRNGSEKVRLSSLCPEQPVLSKTIPVRLRAHQKRSPRLCSGVPSLLSECSRKLPKAEVICRSPDDARTRCAAYGRCDLCRSPPLSERDGDATQALNPDFHHGNCSGVKT